MTEECLICQRHYTQSGRCSENKRNCLAFLPEPRGKKVRTTIRLNIDPQVETYELKYGNVIKVQDRNRDVEMKIIKIIYVNMKSMTAVVEVEYHENEKPSFETKKNLKIMR